MQFSKKEFSKSFATIIFLFLKSDSLSTLIIKYLRLLLKANALLAGIVHGVVVQIIISQFKRSLLFEFFTGKEAYIVSDV